MISSNQFLCGGKKKHVENLLSWLPGKSSDFLLEVKTVAELCYDRYVH